MTYSPEILLDALMNVTPRPTAEAPRDARGLYGLVDHFGDLRYIGSTSSDAETLYKRIHLRHRTGSENSSHYFSRMYNVARMWRDRDDATTMADGDIAKALRNAFVAEHCRAVWLPLPDSSNIARLEAAVLSIRLGQASLGVHFRSCLSKVFASSISFRIRAMMATLAGFPAARRLSYFRFRSGLNRIATTAGM
jgi:hypothetical protein